MKERMRYDAAPGTLVVFDGLGGYPGEREDAVEVLELGAIYTVSETDPGRSTSRVTLRERPRERFNTCLFAAYEAQR